MVTQKSNADESYLQKLAQDFCSSSVTVRINCVYRWHHVRVARMLTDEGHVISARLDDVTERMSGGGRDQQSPSLRLPPSVYYGGMDVSANTFGPVALCHLLTYLLISLTPFNAAS